MSNPDPQDEQAVAEFLDDDSLGVDEVDDIGEDLVRADFPPERQQGIDYPTPGEEPEDPAPVDVPVTGLMASDDDPDEEVADLGDVERRPPAEEAAMHETAPPPLKDEDRYVDD